MGVEWLRTSGNLLQRATYWAERASNDPSLSGPDRERAAKDASMLLWLLRDIAQDGGPIYESLHALADTPRAGDQPVIETPVCQNCGLRHDPDDKSSCIEGHGDDHQEEAAEARASEFAHPTCNSLHPSLSPRYAGLTCERLTGHGGAHSALGSETWING